MKLAAANIFSIVPSQVRKGLALLYRRSKGLIELNLICRVPNKSAISNGNHHELRQDALQSEHLRRRQGLFVSDCLLTSDEGIVANSAFAGPFWGMSVSQHSVNHRSHFCRTWRGEPGEEWSSAQSLESILLSIQSLMSPNPYENEPGFEDARTDHDKKNQDAYRAKVSTPPTCSASLN
jgi:Ubiquitin-conjugating enzyme